MIEKKFKKYYWIIEAKARKFASTTGEDEGDLKSFLHEAFYEAFQDYDETLSNFKTYIDVRLNQRLINYLNLRQNEFNRNVEVFSAIVRTDDEGQEIEFDAIDAAATAELVEYGENKTIEDKQALILDLVKKTDSVTTAIVNEFLDDDKATPTAIGRKLGLHHQTVRRKLNALADNYHDSYDEDYRAFLAI